ncbi:MAG: glycerophosphodiester phosphodiesterase [Pyrinomonadaceae bacterium]
MENDPPLIIGHRGAATLAPENTLRAFERAMQDGADGIEFDVRLSRDGVPVVIHDATLARTGLINELVAELTWEELQKIDVGSWFYRHQRTTTPDPEREKLPSLHQVFDFFRRQAGLLYLEMKSESADGSRLAVEVVRAIREHSMDGRVVVSSFDISLVQEVKNIDSGIRTAALFEPRLSHPVAFVRKMKLVEIAKASGADEIALHYALAGRRVVEKAKQTQLGVVVWTVDNPTWIERARLQGIRALITNKPAAMLRLRHTPV